MGGFAGAWPRLMPASSRSSAVLDHKEKAGSLATRLAGMPAVAVRAAKIAMAKGMNMSLKDGLQLEQSLFCMLFGTLDQKEGMAAFMEKKKPMFTGQ